MVHDLCGCQCSIFICEVTISIYIHDLIWFLRPLKGCYHPIGQFSFNSFYFYLVVNNSTLLPIDAWKWSIFLLFKKTIYVFVLYIQPAQSFTLDMVELILNFINDKIILNLRTVKLRMLKNPIKSFLTFIQCVTWNIWYF